MKKKEEVTITFYAAECGEFHDLGEYTKCRTGGVFHRLHRSG